jgi:hypothetical protein
MRSKILVIGHQEIWRMMACAPLLALVWLIGCGVAGKTLNYANLAITPQQSSVRVGATAAFTAMVGTDSVTDGSWSVEGGPVNGTISPNGVYQTPASVPSSGVVTIDYAVGGTLHKATVTLQNPVPALAQVTPSAVTAPTTSLTVSGSGFISGSVILINGAATPTTFVDSSHLSATLTVGDPAATSVTLQVSNPNPGGQLSDAMGLPVSLASMTVSPSTLSHGNITIAVSYPGLPEGATVMVNGSPFTTVAATSNSITASGYITPWSDGTAAVAIANSSQAVIAQANVPIQATAVSYDVAARFINQAGFGPREDMIEKIQSLGLSGFVDEQLAQPVGNYSANDLDREFEVNLVTGPSVLRLRTAFAMQSFIPSNVGGSWTPNQPWEQKLEKDAFGNYRQVLSDIAGDPNVAGSLNLPGNAASTDPSVHPNQNFARELLQLFSVGPVLLNDDGTTQTDSKGNPIPTYGDDTISDLSRALTGWNYAPASNPTFTVFGIDYSQNLIADETQHDQGSKTIFGNIVIPAGQTAAQDRDQILNVIFNHPNLPPYISRILIQRLVKSQPSPAYVRRISTVFKDDGTGVRGNLAAVVKAILLDPEARAGDTTPQSDDGYVQDMVDFQIFVMSALQITQQDDQPSYLPSELGESWFNPGSVFGYFFPTYMVPGTSINSPEFQLLSTYTIVQRSELLWSIVSEKQPGFNNTDNTWLYNTFKTVPAMTEALNHMLYHGTMSQQEQNIIVNTAAGAPDQNTALKYAVFLALNGDQYTVAH